MKTLSELFKAQGELTEEQKAEFFTNLTEETKQLFGSSMDMESKLVAVVSV